MSDSASVAACTNHPGCGCPTNTSCVTTIPEAIAEAEAKPYDAYARIEALETAVVGVLDFLNRLHNTKVVVPDPEAPKVDVDPNAPASVLPTDKIAYLDMSPIGKALIETLRACPPVHLAFPNKAVPALG